MADFFAVNSGGYLSKVEVNYGLKEYRSGIEI